MNTADLARFWLKVDVRPGCWEWTGWRRNRYGCFLLTGRKTYAHRITYELLNGPIPDGLEIDHLCRNRGCVNPTHLEAVPHQENVRRHFSLRTQCPHGHPYDAVNTEINSQGTRVCRICHQRRSRESYWKARQR